MTRLRGLCLHANASGMHGCAAVARKMRTRNCRVSYWMIMNLPIPLGQWEKLYRNVFMMCGLQQLSVEGIQKAHVSQPARICMSPPIDSFLCQKFSNSSSQYQSTRFPFLSLTLYFHICFFELYSMQQIQSRRLVGRPSLPKSSGM